MPRALRALTVSMIPSLPASRMWLLATETTSKPARLDAVEQLGIAGEDGALGVIDELVVDRALQVGDGDVGGFEVLAEGAALAVSLRDRRLGAVGRVTARLAHDRRATAVVGEVDAGFLVAHRQGDAAIEQDVAAGHERPGAGLVPGDRILDLAPQRPGIEGVGARDAEELLLPDAQCPDAGRHVGRTQETERARLDRCLDLVRRATLDRPGDGHAERILDRLHVVGRHDDVLVLEAAAAQCCAQGLLGDGVRRRPEADDRDPGHLARRQDLR